MAWAKTDVDMITTTVIPRIPERHVVETDAGNTQISFWSCGVDSERRIHDSQENYHDQKLQLRHRWLRLPFSSREVEDLMNDVEIVLLRFFVDHLVGRKSSKHTVVSARRHSLSNSNSQKAYRF